MSKRTAVVSIVAASVTVVALFGVRARREAIAAAKDRAAVNREMGLAEHFGGAPSREGVRVFTIGQELADGGHLTAGDARDLLAAGGRSANLFVRSVALAIIGDSIDAHTLPSSSLPEVRRVSIENLDNRWSSLRLDGASLLGKIGGPGVVSKLMPLLNDPNPRVQLVTRRSLAKLGYKAR